MEYIIADTGARVVYIDKKKVEAIVRNPEILSVPEAEEGILGISVYGGRLVVYRQLGREISYPCGIIIKTERDIMPGIPADMVGEEEADPSLLQLLMQGVWVKKSD
jgi:hypothetical protein